MRIAFVSSMSAAPWGGSEVLWSHAAAEALKQGHSVYASVSAWPTLPTAIAKLQSEGCIIHQRPHYSEKLSTRLVRRIQHALGTKTLEQSLADFHPDIICLSQGGNFDIAVMPILRQYLLSSGVPFCIICHNYDASKLPPAHERQAVVEAYKGARKVFFVSADQAHVSQRQLAQTFVNAELIKNPVNIINPELLPWPYEAMHLAMVGGLNIDFKGQDILLEVLSSQKWLDRTWHLNIYGIGNDVDYIKKLIILYNLANRITLHGHVTDIKSIWLKNKLLLLPSRREAAPLVVVEAMLCGRPVVATAVGSIPEWIQHGISGFIAPAATVASYGATLEEAWRNQDAWPLMGQQAYNWAYQHAEPEAAAIFLHKLTGCIG